ncbi:MAG: aspartate dehydrogenase [Beijerinckiaceae bacterium]
MASLSVAIAGLGAIGSGMVREILRSEPNIHITAVSARDEARATAFLLNQNINVPILPLNELPQHADLVVECLPAMAFDVIADATLAAGKDLMVLSVGQLARRDDLIPAFRARNQRLVVPTGAIMGLDVVRALARSDVTASRMITRKSPASLAGAPYLVANNVDPLALKEPTCIFSGTTREAIKGFPANVNVAVALSLAGIGVDRTHCEIWIDPVETANVHTIEVETAGTTVSMTIRGRPDPKNPRTSQMTALSAVDALRRLIDPVWIGS